MDAASASTRISNRSPAAKATLPEVIVNPSSFRTSRLLPAALGRTMVAMGVDLGGVETLRNLAHALEKPMAAATQSPAHRRAERS